MFFFKMSSCSAQSINSYYVTDKVEKIVTRRAATSSAPVHDDSEAQTERRYNLRKRKWQDEKGK